MTPDLILHTLHSSAWTSDAFYVAMAWTIGAVAWVVAFLVGIVHHLRGCDEVAELILVAPLWGFICLMGAIILGAGWYLWLGLAVLVGFRFLIAKVIAWKAIPSGDPVGE